MAGNVKVIVTGIKEIDRKLKRLPPIIQRKIVRRAVRDGMKLIATEMKVQVPVDTGRMRSAVKVRAVKSRKRGEISIDATISSKIPGLVVKPASGAKPAFYPAIVEYGRSDMPPNAFGRRTFDNKGEAARQLMLRAIRDGIEAEARK